MCVCVCVCSCRQVGRLTPTLYIAYLPPPLEAKLEHQIGLRLVSVTNLTVTQGCVLGGRGVYILLTNTPKRSLRCIMGQTRLAENTTYFPSEHIRHDTSPCEHMHDMSMLFACLNVIIMLVVCL